MLLLVALVQINLYIQLASTTTNVFRQPKSQAVAAIESYQLASTKRIKLPPKLPKISPRTTPTTLATNDDNDENYPHREQNCCSQPSKQTNEASADVSSKLMRENKMDYLFNSIGHVDSRSSSLVPEKSRPATSSLDANHGNDSSPNGLESRADYVMTIPNHDADDGRADSFQQLGLVEGVETFTNNHHNQWLPGDNNNNNPEKQHNSRHYNKYQLINSGSSILHGNHFGHQHHANNKYSSPAAQSGHYNSNAFANNYNYNYIQNLLNNKPNNNNNFVNSFGHSNSLLLNAHPPNGLAPLTSSQSSSGAPSPLVGHHQQQHSYNANNGFLSSYISASSALSAAYNGNGNAQQSHHQPVPSLTYSQPIISTTGPSNHLDQQQQHNFTSVGELPGSSTCGRQQLAGYREPRIVGGNSTYEGEFPWAVSIQRHGNHHCGGVIVGPRWILTAAHCVRSQLVGNLLVRTGGSTLIRSANSLNSHLEHDYLVEQIVMHDDFSRYDNLTASQSKSSANTNNADIALLKLKHEILLNEFAWPVCFPNKEAGNFSGHEATVIGWGKLNEKSEDFSNDLQKVKLTIIDNKVCQNWFRQAGREMPIDERIICAGFKSGGKDACHGDSGGPLLSRINGQYVVVGVVSTGIGCARPLLPGLYSRVSSYINWIEKHVS